MSQLSLLFDEAPAVPEAVVNEVGVMVGNVITRVYGNKRLSMVTRYVEIRLGHVGGQWSFGIDMQTHTEGMCYAPRIDRLECNSIEEAHHAAVVEASTRLRGLTQRAWEDAGKRRAADELLRALEAGAFTETIH